ncbi:MAG: hypothetical protein WAM14_10030 [Candidatus Nitrosopolaris sp.]
MIIIDDGTEYSVKVAIDKVKQRVSSHISSKPSVDNGLIEIEICIPIKKDGHDLVDILDQSNIDVKGRAIKQYSAKLKADLFIIPMCSILLHFYITQSPGLYKDIPVYSQHQKKVDLV